MIFDQYSRYKACSDLIRQAGFNPGNSVLDIGSGPECLFGQFMEDAVMAYVDPLIPDGTKPDKISGNIFSDKLDGKQFDCVSAVDVLEHIPPEKRRAFLDRLSSLGRNILILGFPNAESPDALEADRVPARTFQIRSPVSRRNAGAVTTERVALPNCWAWTYAMATRAP